MMKPKSRRRSRDFEPEVAGLITPATPFPTEVLPTPLARFVSEVAEALPSPPDFVAVPMLALLGCAIGTSRVLRVKPSWFEGPRIYAAVVAEVGTKKSPALTLAALPFYERQRLLFQHFVQARGIEAQACAEIRDLPIGPLSTPSERPTPVMATSLAGDMASPPQLFTSDATLEALIMLLAQNPRGVALIQDELSAWVRSMNQYRGGKGADRQWWLSFWNGAPVIVNRKSRRQPIVLDNPLVGVAGCLPPDILNELSDERGREDGFLHRILFAFPDPIPVRWTDVTISEEAIQGYQKVFDRLWGLAGDGSDTVTSVTSPIPLAFTAQGRTAFIQFANTLYEELADPELPDYLRGPLAKLDGIGARLALIMHLCRVVTSEADQETVDEHSVGAAIALVTYFYTHAKRVYLRLRSSRADQRAAQACRWIRTHSGSCTARDLQRNRVAGVRRASEAEKLVRDLIDLGRGQVEEHQLPSGRTQKVFVLHTHEGW